MQASILTYYQQGAFLGIYSHLEKSKNQDRVKKQDAPFWVANLNSKKLDKLHICSRYF